MEYAALFGDMLIHTIKIKNIKPKGKTMKRSEQINEIAAALSKAQREMGNAIKSSVNPYHKSRYADYTAIVDAIREPFSKNGLSFMQEPTTSADTVSITTLIAHASGQWIEFDPVTLPVAKKDPQGVGAAITYAKRYALGSIVGIGTAEDDDGESQRKAAEDNAAKVMDQHRQAGEPKITEEQRNELDALFDKLPNLERKMAYNDVVKVAFGVSSYHAIKAKDFNRAKITLENAIKNSEVKS